MDGWTKGELIRRERATKGWKRIIELQRTKRVIEVACLNMFNMNFNHSSQSKIDFVLECFRGLISCGASHHHHQHSI